MVKLMLLEEDTCPSKVQEFLKNCIKENGPVTAMATIRLMGCLDYLFVTCEKKQYKTPRQKISGGAYYIYLIIQRLYHQFLPEFHRPSL